MNNIQFLYENGSGLWPGTYGAGLDDVGSLARIAGLAAVHVANGGAAPHETFVPMPDGAGDEYRVDAAGLNLFSALWVHGGCRILDSCHSYFSAMAQTSLAREAAHDLHVPWPAFAVRVPDGLLVADDGRVYNTIMAGQFSGNGIIRVPGGSSAACYFALMSTDKAMLWCFEPGTLGELLFQKTENHAFALNTQKRYAEVTTLVEQSTSDIRIKLLARRAVVGLLYTMQHTCNFKTRSVSRDFVGTSFRKEPPKHRTIIIGKPLAINVSESVRTDAVGGGSSPSVQTLVRGHIKRQVVGNGGLGRKVVWIEPYWRGPEGAPILARPYHVGPKHLATSERIEANE